MLDEQIVPPIATLPGVYRIRSLMHQPLRNERGVLYTVELYHEKAQLTVQFTRPKPDMRLKVNLLVSVRWKLPVSCSGGAIWISRLVLLEHMIKGENLFDTVPPSWVKDRSLVKLARDLLAVLPDNLQQLFCTVLWNGDRFRSFCETPSSIADHHAYLNGNLRHTVETVNMVRMIVGAYPQANLGVSMTAAFLHDAGKAAEYVHRNVDRWALSDRGKLVGHRHTILEWIATAMAMNHISIPDPHYLSLLHALTSAPNAERLGIRGPVTPEATLLSMADRLSGESALTAELAKKHGGWGSQHPHRKSKPFTLPSETTVNL